MSAFLTMQIMKNMLNLFSVN